MRLSSEDSEREEFNTLRILLHTGFVPTLAQCVDTLCARGYQFGPQLARTVHTALNQLLENYQMIAGAFRLFYALCSLLRSVCDELL